MKLRWTIGVLLGLAVCRLTSLSFTAGDEAASIFAGETPVKSTSIPTPPISLIEGSVVALDLTAKIPTLKLTTSGRGISTLHLDRAMTTVWKGSERLELGHIKVGHRVKIRRIFKDGKDVAKSIEIVT